MTPSLALGRRAVACAGWRWKAAGISERIGGYLRVPFDALPYLSDPATRGCLLALVREAWGDPTAMVSAVKDADGSVSHWICYVFPCEDREARFPATIEPAALVAALEAAPMRTT